MKKLDIKKLGMAGLSGILLTSMNVSEGMMVQQPPVEDPIFRERANLERNPDAYFENFKRIANDAGCGKDSYITMDAMKRQHPNIYSMYELLMNYAIDKAHSDYAYALTRYKFLHVSPNERLKYLTKCSNTLIYSAGSEKCAALADIFYFLLRNELNLPLASLVTIRTGPHALQDVQGTLLDDIISCLGNQPPDSAVFEDGNDPKNKELSPHIECAIKAIRERGGKTGEELGFWEIPSKDDHRPDGLKKGAWLDKDPLRFPVF